MAMTEHTRRALFDWIADNVGTEPAEALMSRLPAQSLNDLATRDDVLAMATALRGEMAELRADLRGEMAELRGELKGEMASLEIRVGERFDRMQRWMVGMVVAHAGIGVAVVGGVAALS